MYQNKKLPLLRVNKLNSNLRFIGVHHITLPEWWADTSSINQYNWFSLYQPKSWDKDGGVNGEPTEEMVAVRFGYFFPIAFAEVAQQSAA